MIMSQKNASVATYEAIQGMIFIIRGKKVMIDRDLANLYGVETKVLNQAVKRNKDRFPEDFMFQLSGVEFENWKSQIVTSNKEKMGIRRKPYAFTEHGILMLSSVLNSERAIQVNIAIMRTFTKIRQMIAGHKELARKMKELEQKVGRHDKDINIIIDVIKKMMHEPVKKKKSIGFHVKP